VSDDDSMRNCVFARTNLYHRHHRRVKLNGVKKRAYKPRQTTLVSAADAETADLTARRACSVHMASDATYDSGNDGGMDHALPI
jgi:hypothetical protein